MTQFKNMSNALAATIGRKKYGKKKFQKMALKGRKELSLGNDTMTGQLVYVEQHSDGTCSTTLVDMQGLELANLGLAQGIGVGYGASKLPKLNRMRKESAARARRREGLDFSLSFDEIHNVKKNPLLADAVSRNR